VLLVTNVASKDKGTALIICFFPRKCCPVSSYSVLFQELIAQASFVLTNGNPYLDFPHPTLHKTVMIGGFTVAQNLKKKQDLPEEWNSFLNARKHTILVSFGSVARSLDMPENYK
ncbi:hypothetical protein OESDEN_02587, partial [Oesophagostomum dentatum]